MAKSKPSGWSSDDWYQPGEGQLHFFQRKKTLLWVIGKEIQASAEAWGGVAAVPGVRYPGMKPQLTTAGTYVIHECAPYTTDSWWTSKIRWGTPIKVDKTGTGLLYEINANQRRWARLHLGAIKIQQIREAFHALYKDGGKYDANGDGFPDVWIFNDFGPWAVRYFLDPNRNRKKDPNEKLLGEMIHTTPKDEASLQMNAPVPMEDSHGCIHVRPADRDRFYDLGAFDRGNLIVVHTESEVVPEFLIAR